jgi:hypothetical protein
MSIKTEKHRNLAFNRVLTDTGDRYNDQTVKNGR